jgi:hypothetical protein
MHHLEFPPDLCEIYIISGSELKSYTLPALQNACLGLVWIAREARHYQKLRTNRTGHRVGLHYCGVTPRPAGMLPAMLLVETFTLVTHCPSLIPVVCELPSALKTLAVRTMSVPS